MQLSLDRAALCRLHDLHGLGKVRETLSWPPRLSARFGKNGEKNREMHDASHTAIGCKVLRDLCNGFGVSSHHRQATTTMDCAYRLPKWKIVIGREGQQFFRPSQRGRHAAFTAGAEASPTQREGQLKEVCQVACLSKRRLSPDLGLREIA